MAYDNWGGNEWGPTLFMDEHRVNGLRISAAISFDAYSENATNHRARPQP